jgi:predicted membrane channel-forming protein YqfA (hemolysin III family)
MTIFKLKQLASTSVHAAADAVGWNYDRAELIADGIVHIIGIIFGLIAATTLVVLTVVYATALDIVGVSIYVAGLLSMLMLSATYNLHAGHHGGPPDFFLDGAAGRRLVRCDIRHCTETRMARPL